MVLEIQMLKNLIETVEVISFTNFVNNLKSILIVDKLVYIFQINGLLDHLSRYTRDLFFCYL
jgi:hypothetical protein